MGRLSGYPLQADEYDGCFLGVQPLLAVVTNCEWEHVDIFPNEVPSPFPPCPCLSSFLPVVLLTYPSAPLQASVRSMFRRFAQRVRPNGTLLLCADEYASPHCCHLLTSWLAHVGSVESGALQCRLLLLVYRFQGGPSHPPGGDLRPLAGL